MTRSNMFDRDLWEEIENIPALRRCKTDAERASLICVKKQDYSDAKKEGTISLMMLSGVIQFAGGDAKKLLLLADKAITKRRQLLKRRRER